MANKEDKIKVERRFVKNIFFRGYHIIVPSKSKVKLEGLTDHLLQTHDLKLIRGHFLDLIIEVELITDILIENAMLHKKSKLGKVFRNNILNHRNVTFKPKIELLCAIIKEKKELKKDELKLLGSHLDTLRVERNRWAHGTIRFRQIKKDGKLKLQSCLIYINSKGAESEITLTDSYFDELTNKFNIMRGFLNRVMVKRKLLPKEYLKKKKPLDSPNKRQRNGN